MSCCSIVPRDFIGSCSRGDTYKGEFVELEVEGAKELDILCPVSKLTGFRMSMQQVIFMITDKNSRLADALFEVIPTIPNDPNMDDNDKFAMLVSRLDTGSFAESDNVAEVLGNVAKEFFPAADVEKVVDNAKIAFDTGDAPSDGNA